MDAWHPGPHKQIARGADNITFLWLSNRPPSNSPMLIPTSGNSQLCSVCMYQALQPPTFPDSDINPLAFQPCLGAAVSVSNQIINSVIMSFPRQSQLLLLVGGSLCFEAFSHHTVKLIPQLFEYVLFAMQCFDVLCHNMYEVTNTGVSSQE